MKYLALLVAALLVSPFFLAKAENDSNKFANLETRIGGRIGVTAIDSATGKRIDYRGQERFTMCSTFKLLAAAAVLKRVDDGKEKLDRFVTYGEAQLLSYAPVTRAHVKAGGMSLEALCVAAIEQSDNTAANLLLETIGGPKGWTEFARSLGDKSSRLDRKEPELNTITPGDERDTTTPAAMSGDLQRIFTSNVLSSESQRRLEAWLQDNQTGLTMIRAAVPSNWKVGDKTGRSGTGMVNDIAIVRRPTGGPLFLAIYTYYPGGSEETRNELIATIAKAAIEAINK